MTPVRFYIDASALVKLLVPEPESRALDDALGPGDEFVSSDLVKVEAMRAVKRIGREVRGRPEQWLERISLVRVTVGIRDRAAAIGARRLRALDAIHLATMESLPGLDGLLAYDRRLIAGAQDLGIRVLSPR
jgi:hypothetical protein